MSSSKKPIKAEKASTSNPPPTSSASKLPQNYTKFLHNLVSNSHLPQHKRNNSDYIYAQSKLNDRSALNSSNNNQSINYHSSSRYSLPITTKSLRSPIPSTRYQNIMPPPPKDTSLIAKRNNISTLPNFFSLSSQHQCQSCEHNKHLSTS
jgi:hypothetical protein